MFRFLMLFLMMISVVSVSYTQSDMTAKTHILFTDPFEDSDDTLAILKAIDDLSATDKLILVSANEIVDDKGLGLRAMALYQWLYQLANHNLSIKKALNNGRLSVVQGQISTRFQHDYDKYLLTQHSDTHFYNPGLVANFYHNPHHPKIFKTVSELRQDILQSSSPITITSIASSNDVAHFYINDDLFKDTFMPEGSEQEQINSAKEYYQTKLQDVKKAYESSKDAQELVRRTQRFWQMSSGINGPEEYNEKQSRIASDFLNHLFSAKNHGITPINTTMHLHPMLEYFKNQQAHSYPVDKQILSVPFLKEVLYENLKGHTGEFNFPGYFDKQWNNQAINSLNHDTLALIEAKEQKYHDLKCQVVYYFDKRVKRTYRCLPLNESAELDNPFQIAVSDATFKLITKAVNEKRIVKAINLKTDMAVMDALSHLFKARYHELGIFDFDCTITVDESFKHPTDDAAAVLENTKNHIKSVLRRHGSIFGINSFIDSPENILIYLESIYGEKPILVKQETHYLYNKKRQKDVLAFYIGAYRLKSLPMPLYITNLPKLNPVPDPVTGEKNVEYHMAIEALEDTGKNIPTAIIASRLYEQGYLADDTDSSFFDDNLANAQKSKGFWMFNKPMKSYVVTPHIKEFKAKEL